MSSKNDIPYNDLINWFKDNKYNFPKHEFKLSNFETIIDPLKFYGYLEERMSQGENDIEMKSGFVHRQIQKLKNYMESNQ